MESNVVLYGSLHRSYSNATFTMKRNKNKNSSYAQAHVAAYENHMFALNCTLCIKWATAWKTTSEVRPCGENLYNTPS